MPDKILVYKVSIELWPNGLADLLKIVRSTLRTATDWEQAQTTMENIQDDGPVGLRIDVLVAETEE